MSISSAIFRKGIAIVDKLTSALQATVTIQRWISQTPTGDPVYDTAFTENAVITIGAGFIYGPSGELIKTKAMIQIPRPLTPQGAPNREEPIDPRDKITLPNGVTGPVVRTDGVIDPTTGEPYAIDIWLGL